MIRFLSKYFAGISPMFIDGSIYVVLAIIAFIQTQLSADEAGKFIDLQFLWYLKLLVGSSAAGLLALKLYRSTAYAEHKEEKKKETGFYARPVDQTKGQT